jgi:hypothetical protein
VLSHFPRGPRPAPTRFGAGRAHALYHERRSHDNAVPNISAISVTPPIDLSLAELLEERVRLRNALRLIADAIDTMRRPTETVRMIGEVAKTALGDAE